MPAIFASLLWIASDSKDYNMLLMITLIFMILFGIAMIYFYIKTTKITYGINNLNTKKQKVIRIIFRYILVSILMMLIIFFNLALISFIEMAITDFKSTREIFSQAIIAGIIFYVLSLIIIWGIYSFHLEGLVKRIKYMKILYMQNGEINKGKKIKFEDFDIDKNYFSYLDSKRVKRVIPTKDLLRIEYVYKK